MRIYPLFVKILPLCLFTFVFAQAEMLSSEQVAIISTPVMSEVEHKCISLLHQRLAALGISTNADEPDLRIHIGIPEANQELTALCEAHRIPLPTRLDPGPEGYRLKLVADDDPPLLIAACTDERGVLYAIGEVLRQATREEKGIALPANLTVCGVARFPVRGLIVHQGHTITKLTGARKWTDAEWEQALLEFALAGANTFELSMEAADSKSFSFIKSYGLDTLTVAVTNAGSGPPELQAVEAIGRKGYLCPSIPEARQALLEQFEKRFATMASFDYLHWKSGDGGGCECERCDPYGKVLIELCEDLTKILHRHHPDIQVYVGNQKLDNAGDQAMFDYLRKKNRNWIKGIIYGPGSNGMGWMPGRRQDHRMDLFQYAGFGQVDRYLREMVHQMPPQQSILFFTDLTHWVYSEYGLMDHEIIADAHHDTPPSWDMWMYEKKPDPAMEMVYDRRTFHARPRHYHRIFQNTMRYGVGDVAYSEGHHDHLNQWMWQRLMWNPHESVEAVVGEYCRYHFGPQAATLMTEAIFLHEENLSTPIEDNPGIDRFNELVQEAAALMRDVYMRDNYLWRQYAQKGLIDKYIQLRVQRQQGVYAETIAMLAAGLEQDTLATVLPATRATLSEDIETNEMRRLKEEADRLGKESDALYGVRNEGLFNLDQDFIGQGWLLREIQRALEEDAEAQRLRVSRIIHYEDPGEGGFYDDAGNPAKSPNLVYGWPFGDGIFSGANRSSQKSMAFTTDEEKGVAFRYDNLDPAARYRVRMTLVRPRYLPRFSIRQPQTSQSIYADALPLVEDLELPEYESNFFEYDIPPEATADGELLLWFKKQPGIGEGAKPDVTLWRNTGGWGTLVSEVWLIKATE